MMIVNLVSPDRPVRRHLPEQLRDDLHQGRAGPPARRRRDHLPRPARLQPAGLARPRQARGAGPRRRRRGHRDRAAEHPGRRRADRPAAGPEGPAIPAHHQHPRPADRPRAIRRHHPQGRADQPPDVVAGRPGDERTGHLRGRRIGRDGGPGSLGGPVVPGRHGHGVPGHGGRPAPRRRPARIGLAAVRPVVHARRRALGGALDLPVARLQRPRHGLGRLREDGRIEGPLPRGPGVPDRLRHHAVHPGVGRRGLPDAPRRDHPGRASWSWPSSRTGGPP